MDDLQIISTVGTNMFIAFTVMAAAYWIDATRWSKHSQSLPPGPEKDKAQSIRRTAENLFRWSVGCMLAAIVCMVLPLYLHVHALVLVCKYLILVLFLFLVGICVRYVMKIYFVPVDLNYPEDTQRLEAEPATPADQEHSSAPQPSAPGG